MNVTQILMVAAIAAQAWTCIMLTYVLWAYRRHKGK